MPPADVTDFKGAFRECSKNPTQFRQGEINNIEEKHNGDEYVRTL